jgi:hypothetical protein
VEGRGLSTDVTSAEFDLTVGQSVRNPVGNVGIALIRVFKF